MDVTQELDQLRQRVADCEVVAFSDLGSTMILCVSAESKIAQEELDGLAKTAELLLDGPMAADAARLMPDAEGAQNHAVLATGRDVRVFLRSTARPAEALAMVCRAGADLQAATVAARETLDRIVAADVDTGGGAS